MEKILNPVNLHDLYYNVDDITGNDLYEIPKSFVIPKYQRTYKWDKGLCILLFNDLTSKANEEYNFGFITLASRTSKNTYDVIDGQQRIVSIHLLVLALYSVVTRLTDDERNYMDLRKYVQKVPNIESNEEMNKSMNIISEYISKEITIDDLENCTDEVNIVLIRNFITFKNIIEDSLIGKEINSQINMISDYYESLKKQRLFLLNYSGNKSALDSFIAINMKSKQLDEFEVLSSLLLSRINNEDKITEYRSKLDSFIGKASRVYTFKSGFRSYLTTLIWVQYEMYSVYCSDTKKFRNEARLEMPNHYVENVDLTPAQVMDFIDYINTVTDIYLEFIEKGSLSWIGRLSDTGNLGEVQMISSLISDLEKMTGLYLQSKLIYKVHTVSERYLLAILVHLRFSPNLTNQEILMSLRELMLLIAECHVYNIADNKPWKEDFVYLLNAKGMKTKTNDWITDNNFEKERITKKKDFVYKDENNNKQRLMTQRLPYISYGKWFSLQMFYQTKSSISSSQIGDSNIVFETFKYEQNIEHFFLNNSRIKKGSMFNILKNTRTHGINCFLMPKELNDEFEDKGLKNMTTKIEYIKNLSQSRQKQFNFVQIFANLCEETLNHLKSEQYNCPVEYRDLFLQLNTDKFSEMLDLYSNDNHINEDNIHDFIFVHLLFLTELNLRISKDFVTRYKNFIYSGTNIFS